MDLKEEAVKMQAEYGGKSIVLYTDAELVELARSNHIWLNAFSCIRPTPQFCQELGASILAKLNESEMRDDLGISKMIILTINKS